MRTSLQWMKLIGVSLLAAVLAGCLTTTSTKVVHQQLQVNQTYDTIIASGPSEIHLVRAPVDTPVTITGWPEAVARTQVWTSGSTIHVINAWYKVLVPGTTIVTIPIGNTQHLTADLSDQAIMQVQYLRFANVDLKTSDVAHAQVFALDHLKILAEDHSSVFYYGHPRCVQIERPGKTAEVQHFNTLKG